MFAPDIFFPAFAACVIAYLLGSISTAIIVCRGMGLPDPRNSGSGNPGATNVLRVSGKFPAALTLLGDALKGMLPVVVTAIVLPHPPTVGIVALAAFLGHLYPVFFRFEGGKGVATALGTLFGLSPSTALLAVITWLAVSLVSRMSSLAAMVTFMLVPVYFMFSGQDEFAFVYVIIGAFLIWRHQANIQRIVQGTESKIGK